jgi:LPS O-antigen subunit length determinant protein (WzzB/FepE family)
MSTILNTNISGIINLLWGDKLKITLITFAFSIFAVVYVIQLPNVYQSTALLAPVKGENINPLKNYSGIAAIAGISLSSEARDPSIEAVQRIGSFEFFSKSFLPTIDLQDLMAVKNWNKQTNQILYNDTFNSKSNTWAMTMGVSEKPSNQEAFLIYKEIMNIAVNKETGFISISIEHQSPHIAQLWASRIYALINEKMRQETKLNVTKSINFLNIQLNQTNYTELKAAISELLKEQTQILMLAEANEQYIFKVIDSPIVPEKKKGPKRALFCILAFFGALALSSTYIILLDLFRKNKYIIKT